CRGVGGDPSELLPDVGLTGECLRAAPESMWRCISVGRMTGTKMPAPPCFFLRGCVALVDVRWSFLRCDVVGVGVSPSQPRRDDGDGDGNRPRRDPSLLRSYGGTD